MRAKIAVILTVRVKLKVGAKMKAKVIAQVKVIASQRVSLSSRPDTTRKASAIIIVIARAGKKGNLAGPKASDTTSVRNLTSPQIL